MTGWPEEETLQLAGLQHFAFCRRQWAFIHVEGLWREDLRTVEGSLFHARAHDSRQRERRGDTLILRGLPVFSRTLGVSGQCDVTEFHADPGGVPLRGEDGLWQPYPVEYKRGRPKEHDADRLQLCAQAMCLEEMLACRIEKGYLFYGEIRRRIEVALEEDIRCQVRDAFAEMHQYYERKYTPKAKRTKACNACSLKSICLPQMAKKQSARQYISGRIGEEETD